MSKEEDYLDKLLAGIMGGAKPEEVDAPTEEVEQPIVEEELPVEELVESTVEVEEPAIEVEEPAIEDVDIPLVSEFDMNSEIPTDIDSMGMVIDSAPSLEPAKEESIEADIADLMSDLMPSFEAEAVSEAEEVLAPEADIISEGDIEPEPIIESEEVPEPSLDDLLAQFSNTIANEEPAEPIQESIELGEEVVEEPIEDIAEPEFNLDELLQKYSDEAVKDALDSNEESVIEEPVIDEPIIEESLTEEPVIDELVIDSSLFEEPITANPVIEEPVIEEPVIEEPVIEEPVIEEPIIEEPVIEEHISPAEVSIGSDDLDVDAIKAELNAFGEEEESSNLTEDDIDKMLAMAAASEENEGLPTIADDLSDIIGASNDSEVSEIGELLDKADNNEAIDPGIASLLQPATEVDIFSENLSDDTSLDEKARVKAEKQRLKEEKKAAKQKAKEEKAAAKAAKKAEKAAKKAASAGQVSGDNSGTDLSDVEALLAGAEMAAENTEARMDEGKGIPDIAEADNTIGSETDALTDVFNEFSAPDFSNMTDEEREMAEASMNPSTLIGMNNDDFPDELSLNDSIDSLENAADDFPPILESFDEASAADEDNQEDKKKAKKEKKKKEKKKEKKKKDASDSNEESEKKLPGFLQKIIDFFTESDEEEEDSEKSEIILSDENAAILDEMNQEGEGDKKAKKKGKKGKKGKSEDGAEGEGAEGEDAPKKEKKKKEKKPKKEKVEDPNAKPEKKIPLKKIIAVFMVCIALGAAIFVATRFTGDYSVKKSAEKAYKEEDYQTCYQNLFGKELNNDQEIMYNQSECILRIRLWYKEYQVLLEEGSEVRALDSLIQSVNSYPGLFVSATKWNCVDKVVDTYNEMLNDLSVKYGLTAEEAMEIAAIQDDVEYTRIVTGIAGGVTYAEMKDIINGVIPDVVDTTEEPTPGNTTIIPEDLPDALPEESDGTPGSFLEPN